MVWPRLCYVELFRRFSFDSVWRCPMSGIAALSHRTARSGWAGLAIVVIIYTPTYYIHFLYLDILMLYFVKCIAPVSVLFRQPLDIG